MFRNIRKTVCICMALLSCGCSIQAEHNEKDREGMLNLSVLENEEVGYGVDTVLGGEVGFVVDVDLADLDAG